MPRPSKRPQIEAAIKRRLDAGESLDVRSIIKEAGGSSSTVVAVLREMGGGEPPAAHLPLPAAQIETAMRDAFAAVLGDLLKEVKGATTYSMDKIEHGYQRLMEIADHMKQALPAGRPISGSQEVVDTTLIEARYRQAVQENAQLSRQVEWLIGQLYEAGVEVSLDELKRAGR
ncbi:MAG: hypothetical protein K8L99_04240 [Anaerolineae bacterium]|jgi:hypothetical protein|nr:hypothetical protein [Anaerolineae bacterium]MCZ2115603.1 hypothetical protein [Anaerolineae bacterium]GIK44835.1 MAG: hypothetical protein BroJett012_07380 [Betaproteobacteria bacterium]